MVVSQHIVVVQLVLELLEVFQLVSFWARVVGKIEISASHISQMYIIRHPCSTRSLVSLFYCAYGNLSLSPIGILVDGVCLVELHALRVVLDASFRLLRIVVETCNLHICGIVGGIGKVSVHHGYGVVVLLGVRVVWFALTITVGITLVL